MEDFFSLENIETTEVQVAKRIKAPKKQIHYSCESCALYKKCQHGKMGYQGKGTSKVLVVLDSPSIKSDRMNKVVIGEQKRILQDLCRANDMSVDDLYVIHAIQCRYNYPNKEMVPSCRIRIQETIETLRPKAIVALGSQALDVLIGDKINIGAVYVKKGKKEEQKKDNAMNRYDGYAIPYHGYQTVIYPTYGTEALITDSYNPVMWKKMLKQFTRALDPKPYVNYEALIEDSIEILHKQSEIQNMLLTMETAKYVTFDYETTGLQPYKTGHKIICMSVSNGKKSYAFMLDKNNLPYVKHFLISQVPKIAHNAKYEMIWSRTILNTDVENVIADTMLIAHSLNNNKGLVGLKFQGLVNFGIAQYEEDIKPLFLSEDKKDIHGFNQLYYMDLYGEIITVQEKLLYYCAVDSLLTYWLYDEQQIQIASVPMIQSGIDLFLDAMKCFVDIEHHGMRIDSQKINENLAIINEKMDELYTAIYETDEVKAWDKNTVFNFSSNDDLPHLLYDILGYKIYKRTDTGNPSVDDEARTKIIENTGSEFLKLLSQHKKLYKMRGTYLEGIKKGTYDNVIHPSFNLHTVVTYRTSSSNPNHQNIPKRDKLAKAMIRTVFVPEKGCFIEELDFSSLEVNISQCYNQDENLLSFLLDKSKNMHTSSACDLFFRTPETMLEEERQLTKGAFVFAQSYGSNYKNCAINLWENMGEESKKHVISKGYKNLEQYTEVVKEAEYQFWRVRFAQWGAWKDDNWKLYQENAYIATHTGFMLNAIMGTTQASNAAIQGSASHVLLYTMIYIHRMMKKLELRSSIVGQIHDSIVFNMYPDEAELVHKITKKALNDLRDNWEWVTVSLIMDYEQGGIDESWDKLKPKGRIISK